MRLLLLLALFGRVIVNPRVEYTPEGLERGGMVILENRSSRSLDLHLAVRGFGPVPGALPMGSLVRVDSGPVEGVELSRTHVRLAPGAKDTVAYMGHTGAGRFAIALSGGGIHEWQLVSLTSAVDSGSVRLKGVSSRLRGGVGSVDIAFENTGRVVRVRQLLVTDAWGRGVVDAGDFLWHGKSFIRVPWYGAEAPHLVRVFWDGGELVGELDK